MPVLKLPFHLRTVPSVTAALLEPFVPSTLVEIASSDLPAHWVEQSARACLKGDFSALVTAPLSKTAICDAGLKDIGHTEILARLSGEKNLFMGFWGQNFCVVLATGHLPLEQALRQLSVKKLGLAIEAANQLRQLLPRARAKRPLALVGINPHAGEEGLIGRQEIAQLKLLKRLAPRFKIIGPLVPDVAFLPPNWKKHSVYICPYHDQGLIPFKLVHGFNSGVHLTLGLPFVRTSVDHGTAKDIFGKNKAQYGSMKDAILAAIQLCKEPTR